MVMGFSDISCSGFFWRLILEVATHPPYHFASIFCSLVASLLGISLICSRCVTLWRRLRRFISFVREGGSASCVRVYRSRSRVGDLSSVLLPLRARVLVLHVGPSKGLLNFRQREATHRRCLHALPNNSDTHTHTR